MLRYLTAGESHGPCLTMIIDGVPAGFTIDIGKINHDLWRRQQGYGRGGRMKIEKDEVHVLSGIRHGRSPSSPPARLVGRTNSSSFQKISSCTSDPGRAAEVGSELTLAFMTLLERLAPEERAAYLLREVFDAEYGEIVRVLDRSESACRQVVHRARTRVRTGPRRFPATAGEVEDLAARFLQAVEADDYESLIALLTPNARYVTDGGGEVWAALRPVHGAGRVARCILSVARKRLSMGESLKERIGRINGEPGLLSYADGEIIAATAFEVEAGRISGILRVLNPGKLRVCLPSWA